MRRIDHLLDAIVELARQTANERGEARFQTGLSSRSGQRLSQIAAAVEHGAGRGPCAAVAGCGRRTCVACAGGGRVGAAGGRQLSAAGTGGGGAGGGHVGNGVKPVAGPACDPGRGIGRAGGRRNPAHPVGTGSGAGPDRGGAAAVALTGSDLFDRDLVGVEGQIACNRLDPGLGRFVGPCGILDRAAFADEGIIAGLALVGAGGWVGLGSRTAMARSSRGK